MNLLHSCDLEANTVQAPEPEQYIEGQRQTPQNEQDKHEEDGGLVQCGTKRSIGVVVTVLLKSCCYAIICFSCTNLKANEKCQHAISCNDSEVCFVQKYRTSLNETRYDVGCTYPELCKVDQTGSLVGKRSDHNHIVCQKCCDDTNVCNSDVMCNTILQVPSLYCAACGDIEHPNSCANKTICEKNEVCYLHKYITESGAVDYDLGCKHSTLCINGATQNTFGRRSSSGRHLVCESCCQGEEACNNKLDCSHSESKTINSPCSKSIECSTNLMCLGGRCQCATNDYFWASYACIKKKDENQDCQHTDQCMTTLQCRGNKCRCDTTEYWNESICTKKELFDGTCKTTNECVDTLFCIFGHCGCDRRTYWTGTTCAQRLAINSSCNGTHECKESLRCIDRLCSCSPLSEYWTGVECAQITRPKECMDIPNNHDGIYKIYPTSTLVEVKVYCIMRGDQKWTVIQRRENGSVNFERNWSDYKHGFGSVYGEYWLGNDNINKISSNGQHEISIYLEGSSTYFGYANYSTFRVDDEIHKYTLHITGYSGNTGDSMDKTTNPDRSLNGMKFYTIDQDNANTCANTYHSGWWFNTCFLANLNERYSDGIRWNTFSSSIKKSIMMIRRIS